MSRLPDVRLIKSEDFDKDMQETINKLAFPINSFMEQTRAAFDGAIDFTNLNQEIINLTVITNANGVPVQKIQFKSNLTSQLIGCICISATNSTAPQTYPTSQPFIAFSQNGNIVSVPYISGLQANNKYQLTVLTIGQ